MPLFRTMLSALVAVALMLAPAVSAWASVAKISAMPVAAVQSHEGGHTVAPVATEAPMHDCAPMHKGAPDTDDCPCCAKDKACPAALCLAKCFQLVGIDQQLHTRAGAETALLRPSEPQPPPDWLDQPQPPPPRT